jgi:hypothetical protein
VRHHRFQFSLSDLTAFVLVLAMALAPLSVGIKALGESSQMAVVGICAVAAVGALPRRSRGRAYRLRFAFCCSIFLLVSGWFQMPAPYGQPDLGRVFKAAVAIAVGILGALITGRSAPNSGTSEVAMSAQRPSSDASTDAA